MSAAGDPLVKLTKLKVGIANPDAMKARALRYRRRPLVSRFFRDHFEMEFYVRKLAKNGVKLVSITQEPRPRS